MDVADYLHHTEVYLDIFIHIKEQEPPAPLCGAGASRTVFARLDPEPYVVCSNGSADHMEEVAREVFDALDTNGEKVLS